MPEEVCGTCGALVGAGCPVETEAERQDRLEQERLREEQVCSWCGGPPTAHNRRCKYGKPEK